MKRISLINMAFLLISGCMQGEFITREMATPEQLRSRLMGKYWGKINGIQNISRGTEDLKGIVEYRVILQKIDAAMNQFIGMGRVDIDRLESEIEAMIHEALTSIFKQSVALASKTYLHEISKDLFPIAPWNKKIIWNNEETHVLMLTWIPTAYQKTYRDFISSGNAMTISWDAWVTAVPEVKEFAQNYMRSNKNSFNLTDRIEQFLGLIPSKPPYEKSQNKLFVEMWVRPQDLFRPCLDAEIIDSECTIDPHESDLDDLPPVFRNMSQLIPMSDAHKQWFSAEKKGKYQGEWAMPWTRFGYTYDWGSVKKIAGKRSAQGASEYLIKKGSKVLIHNIIPTDEYPDAEIPTSGYIYSGESSEE
jgi:hypothetical protein